MSPVFLRLELPYPTGVNRVWRSTGGRVLLSLEARAFRAAVMQVCRLQRVMPMAGPVRLQVELYRPRRSGDIDSPLKALLDALTHGGAWLDDAQVDHLEVVRHEDKENPRAVATLTGERWATNYEIGDKVKGKRVRAVPAFTTGGVVPVLDESRIERDGSGRPVAFYPATRGGR